MYFGSGQKTLIHDLGTKSAPSPFVERRDDIMTGLQAGQLASAAVAVGVVVRIRTEEGHHPHYTTPIRCGVV
jgi:hypothetical protein